MCVLLLSGALTSCFTGVESTKQVKLSRGEKKAVKATPEEEFIAQIQGEPLSAWKQGRQFTASSERVALIFEPAEVALLPDSALQAGAKLTFAGVSAEPTVYGSDQIILLFSIDNQELEKGESPWLGENFPALRYQTGKNMTDALAEIVSTQLPMLVDDRTIQRADSLLKGKVFYPRTSLWYDSLGNRVEGEKFVPVKIENVSVTTGNFPMQVNFRKVEAAPGASNSASENGSSRDAGNLGSGIYSMFMSIGENGTDSRTFPTLFTIDNPRKRYSSTTDSNWLLICRGQLALGMTKEECRLSLGTPSETAGGQDRLKITELWRYDDGRVLRFEDGLLVDFRN